MTKINDIRKVQSEYFKDAFDKLRLTRYQEMEGGEIGALVKFKNESFRLQILNDRGLIELGLSSLYGDEQFRGIERFNSFLQLETDQKFSELEKIKIRGKRLSYTEQACFLLNNADRLDVLLSKINYKDTLQRIDAM